MRQNRETQGSVRVLHERIGRNSHVRLLDFVGKVLSGKTMYFQFKTKATAFFHKKFILVFSPKPIPLEFSPFLLDLSSKEQLDQSN